MSRVGNTLRRGVWSVRMLADPHGVSNPFPDQFTTLIGQLAQMCALAGEAMSDATDAVLQADIGLADAVVAGYEEAVAMRSAVEETVFQVLASREHTATDLRATVNAVQIAVEVQSMVELALDVATITLDRDFDPTVLEEVGEQVADMGAKTTALARAAQRALLSLGPGSATDVDGEDDDDAVGRLHRRLLTVLIDGDWTHGVTVGVDVALLSCSYERFADHALNIIYRFGGMPTFATVDEVDQQPIAI